MRVLRRRLTYANVISTLALFLALSGGVVWAASKIGANQLKANSVTTAKIRKNAVSRKKIKANAVSTEKLADGAVNFAKIAAGTSLIGTATGGPVPANGTATISIPLTGTTTFTPQAGIVDLLNIEVRGNLTASGAKACTPTVAPFVNGNEFEVAQGLLTVRAFTPTADEPSGSRPVTSETGPLGLTSPGATQTISAKLFGDEDCTAASTVSVAIAVTQLK